MPFGLLFWPGILHRNMVVALSSMKWQFALILPTDRVVLSSSLQKRRPRLESTNFPYWQRIENQFQKLQSFFTDIIKYLRHVIWPRVLKVSLHTRNAIRWLKPQKLLMDLKLFFEVYYVFCRSVSNFAQFCSSVRQAIANRQTGNTWAPQRWGIDSARRAQYLPHFIPSSCTVLLRQTYNALNRYIWYSRWLCNDTESQVRTQ